jgi:hypothetical protein
MSSVCNGRYPAVRKVGENTKGFGEFTVLRLGSKGSQSEYCGGTPSFRCGTDE